MFRKVLFTFSTRFLSSLLSFLIVVITARAIGAAGRGEITLVMLGCSINLMINSIVGGNALVLLTPSTEPWRLLVPSWVWVIISNLTVTAILHVFGLVPPHLSIHVLFISIMQSVASVHMMVYLGRQRIILYNLLGLLQTLILAGGVCFMIFVLKVSTVSGYINCLYISFAVQLLVSIFYLPGLVTRVKLENVKSTIREILKHGLVIQLSNVAQLFNYRLSYFFLEYFIGMAALGVFSTASTVAESVWLISRSISLVQYSGIVNSKDEGYNRRMTLRMSKLSIAGSLAALLPLSLLPPSFYAYVFGEEFSGIGTQILLLSPGIMALAFATVLAHYFAGLGLNKLNLYTSLTGLAATVPAALVLIPLFGMNGAAIAVSISYMVTSTHLYIIFKKKTGMKLRELIPERADFEFVKTQFFKKS
ncbi:MAG TPA: polysaccharide biosynthesis C-terminal domain-containing protein [Bacteroidia bacterium]|nr:polysaccharide biosynthesis C-terminal domain-containing protein [Bacteroidia bacterium]